MRTGERFFSSATKVGRAATQAIWQSPMLRVAVAAVAAVAALAALAALASPLAALAAPTDCIGEAPDGLALCTAPLISPYAWSACEESSTYTAHAIYVNCRNATGTAAGITSEEQLGRYMACVIGSPDQHLPNPLPPPLNFTWAPDGSTFSGGGCTASAVWKYGAEMRSFDNVGFFNWVGRFVAMRSRTAVCPFGYTAVGGTSSLPDKCVRTPKMACERVGNPVGISNGEKEFSESDYASPGGSPLRFERSYSSQGWHRPLNAASSIIRGFGDFWRHSYDRRIYNEASPHLLASAVRPNGVVKHFRSDGNEVLRGSGMGDRLERLPGATGPTTGWQLRTATAIERYDASGTLLSIAYRDGGVERMTYSDTTTPMAIARRPGLLIAVTDTSGRSIQLAYDALDRLRTMTTPDAKVFEYQFDDNEMLTEVRFPDGTKRRYRYNDVQSWFNGGPYALTGVIDESDKRFANYGYGQVLSGTYDWTEHAGGVERYARRLPQGNDITVQGPLSTTVYTMANVLGIPRVVRQSQPAGSGCAASDAARAYDLVTGNLASADDFNQNRTCYAYDAGHREITRAEGLAPAAACAQYITSNAELPAGSRKISTAWHPHWPLRTQVAEPGRKTTYVYNGQPDPSNNNAVLTCTSGSAQLPDGSPIAVLCKQIEEATTDTNGSQGLNATVDAAVAPRVRTWTYNARGQMLTARGPRTDIDDTTRYDHYADTTANHTLGDLKSVTLPLQPPTTYLQYNGSGQVLQSTDPNGVLTVNVYDGRQRLRYTTVGGQTTEYQYWPTGLLQKAIGPDGGYVSYEYDDAHRLRAVSDHFGNVITYTLDLLGNRIAEEVKDPANVLRRALGRSVDALGRTQQVTGRELTR